MDVQIPCLCLIEERHDHDTVTLRDRLDFVTGTAIRKGLMFVESDDDEGGRAAETLARLTEGYLLFGIESWSLLQEVRDKLVPLPVTHTNIRERLLSNVTAADTVADVAEELYREAILLPLLARASKSSPPTPTKRSTSRPTALPSTPPKPSKRSSTTTTPMAVTETTSSSLGGVSSSSLSSESAA